MSSKDSYSLQNTFTKLLISFFLIVLFNSSCRDIYGQSVQDYQNRMATLPYPFSTVVEYDTATSTFFGRIRVDGVNYLASIASSTGNMITLSKLPSFDGWFRGASALDINNQRFFFIASLEGKLHLCIVDITTGQIIKSLVLSHSVKNIEFDPLTKSLFGISHFGADKFVSIDLNTGKIIEISELTLIKGTGSGAFLEGNNFFFVGYWEGKYHVCVVDKKTGIMKELLGKSIGLNEYLVKSFKKNEDIKTLFTSGVQSCTAIAGYDSESDIGFMAHFTPNYKKIDKVLFEIEKAIQEISNNRGLKYMKLFVVGGVRNNQDSMNNLMTIYTQLIERYGINYDEITKFNTGISHTILIHNGETKIF